MDDLQIKITTVSKNFIIKINKINETVYFLNENGKIEIFFQNSKKKIIKLLLFETKEQNYLVPATNIVLENCSFVKNCDELSSKVQKQNMNSIKH